MVKVHREVLERVGDVRGVVLDTPYGFQENVPQLTEKITSYFSTSLHQDLSVAHFTDAASASDLQQTAFLEAVRSSNYVFAGPGSPSYAVTQWQQVELSSALSDVLAHGGVVCFSSAAALTLGSYTAPIYEIYKVGSPLHWLDGLNVLGVVDLDCAVIPHFDNAEGGNHDTRFCYLGERRLHALEALLPASVGVFGVDEHTAVIIDADDDTVTVRGRGHAYWRRGSDSQTLANGTTTPLRELRNADSSYRTHAVVSRAVEEATNDVSALGERAAAGGPEGMRALASLMTLAATGGEGFIDPTSLVELLLELRAEARAQANYALSDRLRDGLDLAGIDVQDGPDGARWSLRPRT